MKIISIILAVLILGLSIHPCSDSLSCAFPQENHQEESAHAHCYQQHSTEYSDSDSGNHSHDCTPFCSCACCGINILVQVPLTSIDSKIQYNVSPISFFTFQYSFEYLPPIWQPPQIV